MAKSVLFLIHGIGIQQAGWSTQAQNVLRAEYERYRSQLSEEGDLSSHLDFVEVTYNDVFDLVLSRWNELASEFAPSTSGEGAIRALDGLLGTAASATGQLENNKLAKRAGDAILYKGFSLIARTVQLSVAAQIALEIAKRRKQDASVEFGVLGHSLGTAVLHDSLELLCSSRWDSERKNKDVKKDIQGALKSAGLPESLVDAKILNPLPTNSALGEAFSSVGAFSPERFAFKAIFQVSNTSLLLHKSPAHPYSSIVRPNTIVRGIAERFYNIDHKNDPVSIAGGFNVNRLEGQTGPFKTAINVSVEHIHQVNIHALEHYLMSPRVHSPIFKTLIPAAFGQKARGYADYRTSDTAKEESSTDYFPKYLVKDYSPDITAQLALKLLEKELTAVSKAETL